MKTGFLRAACGMAACVVASATGLLAAKADPLVPTLIVDAETGEVLHSEEATRPWFPASTTKLMTAYVALRAVEAGHIKLETPIVASAHAAKQPPSKIGMKPGQEITLENALKILMVKSANDIATVVAEGVGGSVPGFAQMMNREAQRLGMRESRFVNPHGLHNDAQVTSARDMAILARALLREFPEYRELWNIGAVQIGNRKFANTNGLIGRYSGAIGMKTGFVCASGFNLVSAASRDGRTLIAVVFGATSAADRTLKAAQLLDRGFGGSGGFFGSRNTGRSLGALTASLETTAPNRRAEICGRRGPPAAEDEDIGGALTVNSNSGPDRPDMIVGIMGSQKESHAVGARVGNQIVLGPRPNFEPVMVYLGRKPGSTEVARLPQGMTAASAASAFAAEGKAKRKNPLTNQKALAKAKATPKAKASAAKAAAPKAKVAAAKAKTAPPKAAAAKAKTTPPKAGTTR